MGSFASDSKFKPYLASRRLPNNERTVAMRQAEHGLETLIDLSLNESFFPPSPHIVAAIQAEMARLNRYPDYVGDENLRTALAESIGRGITPAHVVTGNGSCDVLAMIATGFLEPGSACIICRPTFMVYEMNARRTGAEIVYVDLEPETFRYDVEAILAAITPRTRLIYLCNPNNPTGTILPAAQMAYLVENVPPHVLIVSDEVYHPFVTAADFPDSLEYVRQGRNLLILHSFSKVYGLAGLRLGYGIAPPEIATYLSKTRQPYHLSRLTIAGALAALEDQTHLERIVMTTQQGRDWLHEKLNGLEIPTWPSQANFILFQPPQPAQQVAERLEQQGILVRPLAAYHLPDHLRVTVGLPAENEQFMAALQKSLS